MYAAFGAYGEELGRPNAETTQIESEEPMVGRKLPPAEVPRRLPENLQAAVVEAAAFPRPLPPPAMYRGYNEVLPGSAERILSMAEKEQDRRIGRENEVLHRASEQDHLGLWLGYLIAALALVTSGFLAMNGHDLVAGVIGCTGIVGAAVAVVCERRG